MSYQKVQNFKCRCPLIRINVFGIHESHQIPNIPCDRSSNDVFLNQHLQWYHNFDSGSARKLVRAIFNNTSPHQNLFSINEPIVKRNIAVEGYKCKCPLTHDGAFGLSDEHDITNVPCGRADKEVLCFQHLQYHHNLSSRAAKKIVLAILSYTPTVTQLFHNDDFVTQSKCAYPSFFNPLNTSALSALLHKNSSGKMENNSIPLDFTVNKQQTYQVRLKIE
ncbi:unnamed protein product [Rotaria socialis]|uniref:Uncharacterized protein n=1 Tax=Rotaria socialis TaxID=392032 RepID=A0A820Z867_9BILA|nr:unnamed protein product [Rotaria socialis]